MSYKAYPFFRDILINECIYFASKNKKLVRLNYKSEAYVGVWTEESVAVSFLTSRDIPFDKVVKMDVDRFATYELDELFDEQDHIIESNNGRRRASTKRCSCYTRSDDGIR